LEPVQKKYDVIIVGGGAAGLLAAATAAAGGCRCLLVEKKDRTGRKIMITGKGRCNITNDCDIDVVFQNIRRNPRFLYSAIYSFNNSDIIDFFNSLGVKTKTERGGRVFPVSDKAADVADALYEYALSKGISTKINLNVTSLLIIKGKLAGVKCGNISFLADKVIMACGGASYPATGSDGTGFYLAEKAGHKIIPPKGSLTGLNTRQTWPRDVMGITLKM